MCLFPWRVAPLPAPRQSDRPKAEDPAEAVRAAVGAGAYAVFETSAVSAAAQVGFGLLPPAGVLVDGSRQRAVLVLFPFLLAARELRSMAGVNCQVTGPDPIE